jgi:hypothetical protein
MNFANMPEEILNYELMEYYDENFNAFHDTIRDALTHNGEDVVDFDYKYSKDGDKVVIQKLVIWTATKVFSIIHDSWGDQLFGLPRNPQN